MSLTPSQFSILRQLFGEADPNQKSQLLALAKAAARKNERDDEGVQADSIEIFLATQKTVVKCPVCGSSHVVKNGKRAGRQRFKCKDCKKSFGFTKETILHETKKSFTVWTRYIRCMIANHSLRKCARVCAISLPTAFVWRHKILDALTNMMEATQLDGIVECDETFQLLSYKGNHAKSKGFQMPRKARKHGGKATKRGLSREQVCVTVGVDLSMHSVGKVSNLGKPSHHDLSWVLQDHIKAGAIMVTDSHRGYCKLANDVNANHVRIPRGKHMAGSVNIQLVNNYHQRLKAMINGLFHGVATKYLNNYVVYHNFVNFAEGSEEHKETSMVEFVFTTACVSLWKKNQTRPAIPCAA